MTYIFSLTTFQAKPHQNNNIIEKRNFHTLLVQKMNLLKRIDSNITAIRNSENAETASTRMAEIFSDDAPNLGLFRQLIRCFRDIQAFGGGIGDTFLMRTDRWRTNYRGEANPVTREQRTETLESNEIELLTDSDNVSFASDIANARQREDWNNVNYAIDYMNELRGRLNVESFFEIINSLPLLGGDLPEVFDSFASDIVHEEKFILISMKVVYYLIQIATDRLCSDLTPALFDSTFPLIENVRYVFINDVLNPPAQYVESFTALKDHVELREDIESIPRHRLREYYCFTSIEALNSHREMLVRIFGTPIP